MVSEQVIVVVPVEGGWTVECSIHLSAALLPVGAKAEANARKLASCIAELGQDVGVMIHARDSTLVGTRRHFAP